MARRLVAGIVLALVTGVAAREAVFTVDPLATYRLGPGWATFGLALPKGAARGAVSVGTLATQTDVKTRWPDGSIRFAIVTARVISAGSYPIAPAPAVAGSARATWPSASVELTIGPGKWLADLPAVPSDLWLAGPVGTVNAYTAIAEEWNRQNPDTQVVTTFMGDELVKPALLPALNAGTGPDIFEGGIGPRKAGWYQDMFPAGFEGEDMPASERWRAPQWLAERAVKDPRFPIAMVEHVYYLLFGRKVLQPPEDIDDPLFGGKRRALLAQRALIEEIAQHFTASKFNLKVAIKAMIASDFYQADGLATLAEHPQRQAELDDVGIVRLLSPEQLERKIAAIFGKRWGRLNDAFQVLYGGIDSITVTERNADPSGAMGAIQRLMANDVSCFHVARDFRLEPAKRLLFPQIEPDVVPGEEAANQKIRQAIVHLHQRLLGHDRAPDHPEIERTFALFSGIITDAKAQSRYEPRDTYFCGGREAFKTEDPHYTHRAWRGVLTYLLRQHDFLYE